MDKKEQNEILHEIVDHIKYSKNGRSAEVEIEVQLKEEVKEIMEDRGAIHPYFFMPKKGST